MKDTLTPQERKVLSCIEMDWRLDVPEIVRRSGLRPHVVSYAIKKLKARKLARRFVMYNIHTLGLTDFCIFFNVHGTGKRIRDSVISHAVESAQTTYVAELSGRYQYSASIMATSIFEVESFFDDLAKKLKQPAIDLSFGIRAQWSIFPRKYLDPIAAKAPHLTRTKSESLTSIDSVDNKLLTILSGNPDIPWSQLANTVGIPYSTVRYRIDSLLQRGVIIGFPHAVDGARLGKHPFRILIVARGLSSELRRDLFSFAASHKLCTMFVRCVGAWDFELNYDLEELSQGGEMIQEIYDAFGDYIQSTASVTELSVLKAHEWPSHAVAAARELSAPSKKSPSPSRR